MTRSILVFSVLFAVAGIGRAADLMPAADENAVVRKYCLSCHSDALMFGGLSVQHFDAAHTDPTITAMLLSKITKGHTPRDVTAADSATIAGFMKGSAMGAAGKGVPDAETQLAFARTLALQSTGAYEWNVIRDDGSDPTDRGLTASILRERPSVKRAGSTDSYRLAVSCRAATDQGEIKLTWADVPAEEGQAMPVTVDAGAPFQHRVEGGEAQGNGKNGPGATVLKILLPVRSLRIGNLFAGGDVEFPFGDLSAGARQELSVCFEGKRTAAR